MNIRRPETPSVPLSHPKLTNFVSEGLFLVFNYIHWLRRLAFISPMTLPIFLFGFLDDTPT